MVDSWVLLASLVSRKVTLIQNKDQQQRLCSLQSLKRWKFNRWNTAGQTCISWLLLYTVYVCVVVKNPPYEVSESGYGSFECRIDIYFRNKGDPRRLTFVHDLALTLDRTPDPIVVARCEKLTFRSPSEEFTQCLLRAGGVSNWFCCYYLLTATVVLIWLVSRNSGSVCICHCFNNIFVLKFFLLEIIWQNTVHLSVQIRFCRGYCA